MKPVQKFGWPGLVLFAALPVRAEKKEMAVEIVDRQYHQEKRVYVVPGYAESHGTATLNCSTTGDYTNCDGAVRARETSTPPQAVSYLVRGATFTLALPDGRRVVVNCAGKKTYDRAVGAAVAAAVGGAVGGGGGAAGAVDGVNRSGARDVRSCRMPTGNDIRAEFSGSNAKLKWPVSLDGKKIEWETYQILGMFDAPAQ